MKLFFVSTRMIMLKICTKCSKEKEITDFYKCSGKYKSECKACTVKGVMKYSKTYREENRDEFNAKRRKWTKKHYANNRELYAKWRAAFKANNPDYYRNYYATKRNRNNNDELHKTTSQE